MAAARDVWSFSMSLLRWREGDYGLCGAVKPYITLLSFSLSVNVSTGVCMCVCGTKREIAVEQSKAVPNHKTKC